MTQLPLHPPDYVTSAVQMLSDDSLLVRAWLITSGDSEYGTKTGSRIRVTSPGPHAHLALTKTDLSAPAPRTQKFPPPILRMGRVAMKSDRSGTGEAFQEGGGYLLVCIPESKYFRQLAFRRTCSSTHGEYQNALGRRPWQRLFARER